MRHVWQGFVKWLGARDYLVLIAVALIAGLTWGFIALLDEVQEGGTQRFDAWAIRTLGAHQGPEALQEMGRDITALGGIALLSLLTITITGFLILEKKYHAAFYLLVATCGGGIISTVLKHFVNRDRPALVPHHSFVSSTSFPSGHSMLSAIVYLTLGALLARYTTDRKLRLYFLAVALTMTFMVGVSRVYVGVHWPTDVLAGWTAGAVWALICWIGARKLQRKGEIEKGLTEDKKV
jgi:undecaprenyl-diphosphatase